MALIIRGLKIGGAAYDDSKIKEDIASIKGVLGDAAEGLVADVNALQAKEDKDTVYDDSALAERVSGVESSKTPRELNSMDGKALIFNETDGGGAKFEHKDGTNSFVGVNNGGKDGIGAQIYMVNSANAAEGVKINVEKDKITYIKNKATSARTADDEIATIAIVKQLIQEALNPSES